jgi:hypothetical protein
MKKEGRIISEDWSKYDMHHVVFKPKNMTPEELLFGTEQVYKDFYSGSHSLRRMKRSLKVGLYPFIFLSSANYFMYRSIKQNKGLKSKIL